MTARDGSQQQQHHLHPVTMNIGCDLALSSQCAVQDLDPIVNLAGSRGLITAEWKVGICEFLLLVSLLFFVQAIRLLMYLVRRHGCSAVPACVARQKHVVRMALCSRASVTCQCLLSANRLVWRTAKAGCCVLSSRRACIANTPRPAARSATRTHIGCPATACHLSVERPSSGMGCPQSLVMSDCCSNGKSMTFPRAPCVRAPVLSSLG